MSEVFFSDVNPVLSAQQEHIFLEITFNDLDNMIDMIIFYSGDENVKIMFKHLLQ